MDRFTGLPNEKVVAAPARHFHDRVWEMRKIAKCAVAHRNLTLARRRLGMSNYGPFLMKVCWLMAGVLAAIVIFRTSAVMSGEVRPRSLPFYNGHGHEQEEAVSGHSALFDKLIILSYQRR